MAYRDVYLNALRQQQESQPSYTQGELSLERLTVADALQINLKFITCYELGELSKDDFIKQCILLVVLRDKDKRLFSLSDLTTEEITAQIQLAKPDQFSSFWAVAVEYFLFIQLMTTPPVPPDKARFYDYNEAEQLQAIKNSYLAIDSIVRVYQVESCDIYDDTPLIDFAVTIGALTINGGVMLADRVAMSLKSKLESIAYLTEINNVYTSAKDTKNPNQVVRGGFRKLGRAGYFQDTPLKSLLTVRTKEHNEATAYVKQQVKTMAYLKRKNPASYNEKLAVLNSQAIQNAEALLQGKPELTQLEEIKADMEALHVE